MESNLKKLHYNVDSSETIKGNLEDELEEIMNIYGTEIKRFIYSYINDESDADDVTQDVFVTVYQKLDTFRGESTLRSWIYSIAINKSKDYLRSWKSRNLRLREKLVQFTNNKDPQDTPENYVVNKSDSNHLLQQVLSLPVKYREVIILYYFKELSVKEIADALSTKETTVRTHLNRGRNKIKNLIEAERGGENG